MRQVGFLAAILVLYAPVIVMAKSVNPTFQAEQNKLLASDGEQDDDFSWSVSVSGGIALVGAWSDGDNGNGSGSAYVFVRDGGGWTEQDKLLASDGEPWDRFGSSVSVSGVTALVGSENDDDNGNNSGSAYVFVQDGGSWAEQAKLLASDGAPEDGFGRSVSISGDSALVGAYGDDENGQQSGSVYIFARQGEVWSEQDKLLASDGAPEDWFGAALSVSGNTALVGAFNDDDSRGSAYVFVRDGGGWTEQDKLLASDGEHFDAFGWSVSISGDTALVGSEYDDDSGQQSGSAYVFVRNSGSWSEQAKLLASDGEPWDRFGSSVSISGDTALVGAYGDDDSGQQSGSVYIFARQGEVWSEQDKLLASDGAPQDWFGTALSVSGDTALVGAFGDDDNGRNSGSAYVFWIGGIFFDNFESGDTSAWSVVVP